MVHCGTRKMVGNIREGGGSIRKYRAFKPDILTID